MDEPDPKLLDPKLLAPELLDPNPEELAPFVPGELVPFIPDELPLDPKLEDPFAEAGPPPSKLAFAFNCSIRGS